MTEATERAELLARLQERALDPRYDAQVGEDWIVLKVSELRILAALSAPRDREAIARALFQRFKDRAAARLPEPKPGSYALDTWDNLPMSFKNDFYLDADAILALSPPAIAPEGFVVDREAVARIVKGARLSSAFGREFRAGDGRLDDVDLDAADAIIALLAAAETAPPVSDGQRFHRLLIKVLYAFDEARVKEIGLDLSADHAVREIAEMRRKALSPVSEGKS